MTYSGRYPKFLYDKASRAALHRCLKRHGVSNLRKMEKEKQELTGTVPQKKTFKDYEPVYIHIDIKYLPQMADDSSRRYLLVAVWYRQKGYRIIAYGY